MLARLLASLAILLIASSSVFAQAEKPRIRGCLPPRKRSNTAHMSGT